jgi:hypothetical protein
LVEKKPISREEALASCLDDYLSGKASLEACVERFPEYGQEIEELLPLALLLAQARGVEPPAEHHEAAASRLQARLAGSSRLPERSPVAAPGPGTGERIRRLLEWLAVRPARRYAAIGLLALLLVALGGLAGVAAVDAAGPGDALYRTDLALEQAQLWLARDEEGRTQLRLAFAGERLEEAEALAEEGDRGGLQVALVAYGHQVQAVAATSAGGVGGTGEEALNQVLAGQEEALTRIFRRQEQGALNCEEDAAGVAVRHPLAAGLAAQYGQPYAAVAEQLCAGVPFGQLMLALATGQEKGLPAEAILSLRRAGAGWGQVWQLSGEIGPGQGDGAGPPAPATEPVEDAGDLEGTRPDAGPPGPPVDLDPPGRDDPPGRADPPPRDDPPGRSDPPGRQDPPGRAEPPGRENPPGQDNSPGRQDPPGRQDQSDRAENGNDDNGGGAQEKGNGKDK